MPLPAVPATPGGPLATASRGARLSAVAGLPLLHLATYWIVTRVTVLRGPDALVTTTLPADALVPYVPGSWPLYWVAYLFVVAGGGLALFRMRDAAFRRAVASVAGMMVIGSIIQVALPAQAPWPAAPAHAQRLFHDSTLILPYATLPSMHVAYCTITASFLWHTVPARWVRGLAGVTVVAVAASTLLLREHVLLDALTGAVLGFAAGRWWRGAP